jgi:hypothetical protein
MERSALARKIRLDRGARLTSFKLQRIAVKG